MFGITRVVLPLLVLVTLVGSQRISLAVEPSVAESPGRSTPKFDPRSTAQSPAPQSPDELLVTVNGTPIGQADVDFAMRGGHGNEFAAPRRKDVLERIIQEELARQKAVELGLDANPNFREKLRCMEAQLNAFKRKELSEVFARHEITRRAEVSDADARQYFVNNATRIRTELHIWQILGRKENLVRQALNEIQLGASFEEVARRRFPNLPSTAGQPWNLGYLKWTQVPKSWRSVVHDLKSGEVSGVIKGPNRRFWIIKLIDKREDVNVTFESMKPVIVKQLKNVKIEELRETTHRDLRANANIVYARSAHGDRGAVRVPPAPPQSKTPPE